jgi:16S rRNA (cytidine1402-2'-O)-methyltransferase
MGRLYLIATPIGNLEDISQRALRLLRQVSLIAAEDTRHTQKLLTHFAIDTHTTSYHEHNKLARLPKILAALEAGDVALVSDAGTPGLNDPGFELVQAVIQAGFEVSPVPGPCAPIAALVSSGLPSANFLYLGYLPRRTNERRQALLEVSSHPYTLVCLETPHRLNDSLIDMKETLGDRQIAVARELTKLYEEIYRGRLEQAIAYFSTQPPRGEITLVIAGNTSSPQLWSETELKLAIQLGISQGQSTAQLAARLANDSGWSRRKIYQLILQQETSAIPQEDIHHEP